MAEALGACVEFLEACGHGESLNHDLVTPTVRREGCARKVFTQSNPRLQTGADIIDYGPFAR